MLFMTVASQVKQALATLKGVQGTLRIYATQSRDKETTAVFNVAVETTEEIVKDLEDRVKTLEFKEPQYKGK